MSLVNSPLASGKGTLPLTVRAMEVGQYFIAALLVAIGVIRAVGDGTPVLAAAAAGVGILAWHVVGAVLASRGASPAVVAGWLAGFALVWAGACVVSAEFVWVAFLLWLLAGHLLPGGWAIAYSLVVLAIVILAPIGHHGTTTYANVLGPAIGGLFALGISRGYLQLLREAAERDRLLASLTRAQQDMVDLHDELALAQRHAGAIAERTRVSRDLHDTVAQGLSSIRLLAHASGQDQIETLAGASLTDIRRIVAALAPAELDEDALAAALARLLERVGQETGIRTDLQVDLSLPFLPAQVEIALLRTAQSALANVRLHSGATRVVVSLIDSLDTVRLDIIDDGTGFDPAALPRLPGGEASSSYGLQFMSARLRELGGGLDVESAPGEGTAISAYLPIQPPPEHL